MITLFKELRRRNMFRLTGAYVVSAYFIVQAAVTLKAAMDLPGWFDTMIVALAIIGFPIALVLGWIFDLTPDGFERTKPRRDDADYNARKGRIMDFGIVAGLLALIAVTVYGRTSAPPSEAARAQKAASASAHSVAVLPFANRSMKAEDAYFADGMHDDLLTQLSKISALDVISRTSVMGYRDTDKRIPDIARELGVAAVLEGAVQRAGDRVRITVQLIDGTNDTHLWAQNYDRELSVENIFDIQAEITQVIASALHTVLTGEEQSRLDDGVLTRSVEAYDSYIKGSLALSGGARDLNKNLLPAIAAFDAAIKSDPDFGQAYADKAYAQLAVYWFYTRKGESIPAESPDALPYTQRAKAALLRAKRLSPNALETHLATAYYHYWAEGDFTAANAAFDAGLRVAPSDVRLIAGQAFLNRRLGNFDRAVNLLAKAHRLDPLSYYLKPELALSYAFTGDFDKANILLSRAEAQKPDDLVGHLFAAAVKQFSGDVDGAWAAISKAYAIAPDFVAKDRMNYALPTRNPDHIRAALNDWPETARAPKNAPHLYHIAQVKAYTALGELDKAEVAREEIRAGYDADADPVWAAGAPYSPVILPGLLGDTAAIERAARAPSYINEPDQQLKFQFTSDIADSFVRAGQLDRAMDFISEFIAVLDPRVIAMIDSDPAFDALKSRADYRALKARAAALK